MKFFKNKQLKNKKTVKQRLKNKIKMKIKLQKRKLYFLINSKFKKKLKTSKPQMAKNV